jgi:hypothetical protein
MLPEHIWDASGRSVEPQLENATTLHNLIIHNELHTCLVINNGLNLTVAYVAGALNALGKGQVQAIIPKGARTSSFDLPSMLALAGLTKWATVTHCDGSYNWALKSFLEGGLRESVDLCVLEGGRTWSETGFAVCIIEQLLRPRGWLVLDNLDFSFRRSGMRDKPWVRNKPEDEQVTTQVERVFALLVQGNPNFRNFRRYGALALARKNHATWTTSQVTENAIEIAICDAVDRAHYDPDYRELLLDTPGQASPLFASKGSSVVFVEGHAHSFGKQEQDCNGSITVHLEQPAWEKIVEEAELERMLRE